MAEGELCFKNAFKKFLDKTNSESKITMESQNIEYSYVCDSEKKLIEVVENLKKSQNRDNLKEAIIESKFQDSDIEFKQMISNSEESRKNSSPHIDDFLSKQISVLKSFFVTAKAESSTDSLKSSSYPEDLTHNISETDNKLEFFHNKQTECKEADRGEQFFFDNVSGNIYNYGANKHLFDDEVCDASAQISSLHNEHSQEYKRVVLKCLTKPAEEQNKQIEFEHQRKIFMNNFDEDMNTMDLYYYFVQFGEVERSISIRDYKAKSKFIGYILIFTQSDSVTAILTTAPHVICHRTLNFYLPKKDGSEPEKFCKMFVGNLNFRTTEHDLLNHFQRWGEIVNCVIKRKPEKNISKCYGFVTFKLYSAMNDALVFRYHRIRGRNLKVDMFREDPLSIKRYVLPHKIAPRRKFLTEEEMLEKIEKSKIFRPRVLDYELNDFDGAGINIFKNSPMSKKKSNQ